MKSGGVRLRIVVGPSGEGFALQVPKTEHFVVQQLVGLDADVGGLDRLEEPESLEGAKPGQLDVERAIVNMTGARAVAFLGRFLEVENGAVKSSALRFIVRYGERGRQRHLGAADGEIVDGDRRVIGKTGDRPGPRESRPRCKEGPAADLKRTQAGGLSQST